MTGYDGRDLGLLLGADVRNSTQTAKCRRRDEREVAPARGCPDDVSIWNDPEPARYRIVLLSTYNRAFWRQGDGSHSPKREDCVSPGDRRALNPRGVAHRTSVSTR